MVPGMSGRRCLRRPNHIEAVQPADTGRCADPALTLLPNFFGECRLIRNRAAKLPY
jgi:hypothetical protein